MKRGNYKGAEWPPVVNGRCTKHRTPVTPITKICMDCHREQLAAGQAGPRDSSLEEVGA